MFNSKAIVRFTCLIFLTGVLHISCLYAQKRTSLTITRKELQNKIKGGWAGQTIGVTFGGPTEFKFNGTFIQDYQQLQWYNGYLKKSMLENPEIYDDIYMDLTFVDVLDRLGINAPVDSFAHAFAYAKYELWHANRAARYNIIRGLKSPETGHWLNNPHADDIDFQIEADFAGLMSPGMPNTAIDIGDKIGHIMNYGDGWYGGVFVSAMYSLAFTSNDVDYIVAEALKTIPQQSDFYKCIADVIKWNKQYPQDWKQTWFEIQKKWTEEVGCPEGIFSPFNIDAKANAAYVVMGLLYGKGDFSKTMQICTRAGFDSDCNPSTAGGILGVIMGYDKIPSYWKQGLSEIEDIDFKYTKMSLNKVYKIGFKHALENIERNGGQVNDNNVSINFQSPKTVRFEKSFDGVYPVSRHEFVNESSVANNYEFTFEGTGFIVRGSTAKKKRDLPEYVYNADLFIDGKKIKTYNIPTAFDAKKYDMFWNYQLPKGKHKVKILILNPNPDYEIRLIDQLTFSDSSPNTSTNR